jgi:hypothetical protein
VSVHSAKRLLAPEASLTEGNLPVVLPGTCPQVEHTHVIDHMIQKMSG